MSAVEALAPAPEPAPIEAPINMDAELDAIYERNHVTNGAERADDGKFTSPDKEEVIPEAVETEPVEAEESVLEGAEAGEAEGSDGSTPSDPSVPLPANWNGKDELWSKVPKEIQADIAAIQNELQARLSDQGRKIAEAKPITDTVAEFRHLFEGRVDEQGRALSPHEGIRRLAAAQQGLENPQTRLQTIMSIVDGYGARDHLAAILSGKAPVPVSQPVQPQPNIDAVVEFKVSEKLDLNAREAAVSSFSQANPIWNQVGQEQQYNYTLAARTLLPTASYDAVLKRALALAIEDTPALKAQIAAAAKPAVVPKSVSPEAAKRAKSVNVPSTATGKVKEPTEDELLSRIYDKHQRG